jgi:hypothetical protein
MSHLTFLSAINGKLPQKNYLMERYNIIQSSKMQHREHVLEFQSNIIAHINIYVTFFFL